MTLIRARGPARPPGPVIGPAAARGRHEPPPIPLTHHQIMGLVGPFVRQGRSVDLAASDRAQRRIVFKPVLHPASAQGTPPAEAASESASTAAPSGQADAAAGVTTATLAAGPPDLPALTETLILDHPGDDRFRLERQLALPGGLQACLVCHGADPAAMLAAVLAVPLARQVRRLPLEEAAQALPLPSRADNTPPGEPPSNPAAAVEPVWLALSHSLVPDSGRVVLTEAHGQVAGLRLAMTVSRVKGIPAELTLTPLDGLPRALPEDLLAVLGLPWKRLGRSLGATTPQWRASIALRGFDSERTRDAEEKFQRTARHLAETLARPPAQFHTRFRRARWLVVLRRLTPLLVALALIGAALLVPQLDLGPDSVLRMLIFNSPPLLLAALFCMREMPRIEIPPRPRPSDQPHWGAGPTT